MKKIIYICDHCGEEIPNGEEEAVKVSTFSDDPGRCLGDLCLKCYEAFTKTIRIFMHVEKEQPEPEHPKPEPEKPKKGVKGNGGARHKVKLDLGKVGALYAAGWSVKQIAEEMHCSEQTIRNHLNEAVQSYKDVMEEK